MIIGYLNKTIFLLTFFVFWSVPASAWELDVRGLENGVRQGDVLLLKADSQDEVDTLSGYFEGEKVFFQEDKGGGFTALLGAEMDLKPGEYDLYIFGKKTAGMVFKNVKVEVLGRNYAIERLSLPQEMVTPDKSMIERIRRESRALGNVRRKFTKERYWEGDFVKPVEGAFSNNFGARRILNGVSKNPHSGTDIKASKGTPVRSPNGGRVIYVEKMYYGGKTVVIDHGHGLSTLYMHLSKIYVRHGQEVEKGQMIGRVGSTGRSTGPHLHWAAYVNGNKVDPSSLLSLSLEDDETGETVAFDHSGTALQDQLGGAN